MKRISDFNEHDRKVIRERRHGAEQATPALLAKVFDTTPQVIGLICKAGA